MMLLRYILTRLFFLALALLCIHSGILDLRVGDDWLAALAFATAAIVLLDASKVKP